MGFWNDPPKPGELDGPAFVVRKTANETVTSSTTPQDDDHLFFPLAADALYLFKAVLIYSAATAGDARFGFAAPPGATIQFGIQGVGSDGTTPRVSAADSATTLSVGGLVDETTKLIATLNGLVVTGGTSGDLQLQWCQSVTNGTATTLYANSFLEVQRIPT